MKRGEAGTLSFAAELVGAPHDPITGQDPEAVKAAAAEVLDSMFPVELSPMLVVQTTGSGVFMEAYLAGTFADGSPGLRRRKYSGDYDQLARRAVPEGGAFEEEKHRQTVSGYRVHLAADAEDVVSAAKRAAKHAEESIHANLAACVQASHEAGGSLAPFAAFTAEIVEAYGAPVAEEGE